MLVFGNEVVELASKIETSALNSETFIKEWNYLRFRAEAAPLKPLFPGNTAWRPFTADMQEARSEGSLGALLIPWGDPP